MISFRLTVFALVTIHTDFYILETTVNLTVKMIKRPYIFTMIKIYRVQDSTL